MATATATLTAYNAPYALDTTATRTWLRGTLAFGAGNYVTGGLLPNWSPTTGLLSPLQDVSGQNMIIGTYTQPATANITGLTVSGTTCVFLTANPPAVGQWVTFSGFTNADSVPLNGITAQIASISAGVSFTCTITTTATTVTDNGLAVVATGPDEMFLESQGGTGYVYRYNKANDTIQIFVCAAATDPLEEYGSGTALASGITGDKIHFCATWVKQ